MEAGWETVGAGLGLTAEGSATAAGLDAAGAGLVSTAGLDVAVARDLGDRSVGDSDSG